MPFRLLFLFLLTLGWSLGPGTPVLEAEAQTARQGTGLPLPRFVSLRSDEANLRTGPGVQYPVEWIYRRAELPMEVIAEFGTWRKVRDWEGAQGWIHQTQLSNKRFIMVQGVIRTLREQPDTKAKPVARVEPTVIGRLRECPDAVSWCRVQFGDYDGWLRRGEVWGIHLGEIVE